MSYRRERELVGNNQRKLGVEELSAVLERRLQVRDPSRLPGGFQFPRVAGAFVDQRDIQIPDRELGRLCRVDTYTADLDEAGIVANGTLSSGLWAEVRGVGAGVFLK